MRQYLIILFAISSLALQGQAWNIDTLEYSYNDEIRTVLVFYPEAENPSDSFDIIYMLDGEMAASRFMIWDSMHTSRPMIGVGILNTYRNRDMLPLMDPGSFLAFIEETLTPSIEMKYNIKERILFGHSFAGGFTINAMIRRPGLFDKYIASSPTPIKSFIDPRIYLELDQKLDKDVKFFFSNGSRDMRQVRIWTAKLNLSLNIVELEHLKWKNEVLEGRNHSNSAREALHKGLFF